MANRDDVISRRQAVRIMLVDWGATARFVRLQRNRIATYREMLDSDGIGFHGGSGDMSGIRSGGQNSPTEKEALFLERIRGEYEGLLAASNQEIQQRMILKRSVDCMVAALPDGEREVVICRFEQGLSVKGTAERLHYSERWVRSKTNSALDNLAERVGETTVYGMV